MRTQQATLSLAAVLLALSLAAWAIDHVSRADQVASVRKQEKAETLRLELKRLRDVQDALQAELDKRIEDFTLTVVTDDEGNVISWEALPEDDRATAAKLGFSPAVTPGDPKPNDWIGDRPAPGDDRDRFP